MRGVVNRLEKLEVALLYNTVSETTLTNYNIVSQIIFEEKTLSHSTYLIEHYPYIINVYNITKEHIIDTLVDKYLSSLLNYVTKNKDKIELFYYDNILLSVLQNEKIKVSEEVISKNLEKILTINTDINNNLYNLWLKHLKDLLVSKTNKLTNNDINIMYNINSYKMKIPQISKPTPSVLKEDDYIITIDGDTTIDKDDALSICQLNNGNYLLKIIIADPNYYFDINSEIMETAKKRGESLYYPNETKHMLPEIVITNYLSLDVQKRRPARIYCYEIDKNGEVINFKIEKIGVIISNNLTYEKANKIIEHNCNNKRLEQTIYLLLELKNKLVEKYGENKDEDYKIQDKLSKSELLISQYMIFNNHQVAQYFYENDLPFIYRAHVLHKELDNLHEKLTKLNSKDKNELEKVISSLEKISMTSFYSSKPQGHDGLGFKCYGFTTSPIRRFADIIANAAIDTFYFKIPSNQEVYRFINYLESSVKTLNERHIEIVEHYKKRTRF